MSNARSTPICDCFTFSVPICLRLSVHDYTQSLIGTLVCSKTILDHLPAFHHETNTLQFSNVGHRITCDGDQIGEFSRLDHSNTVLPAQHFCCVDGDGTEHIERRHSGVPQINERCNARLPASSSRIKPAHVRSGSEAHSRLQNPLNQILVLFVPACTGGEPGRPGLS